MAAAPETGMDKAAMKRLLTVSKKEPVNCAMAAGTDAGLGLLLLDKIKQPQALEKVLVKDFPDAKNPRRGMAFVDLDDDAKLVKFKINKPASGMARRLVKTLKGTGFSKVEIVLEDDTFVESAGGEDDEEEEAAQGGQAVPAAPEAPAATPALAAAAPPDAKPDAGQVTRDLTALVKRIQGVADPARKAELAKLAGAVQAALKGGDVMGALKAQQALTAALDGNGQAGAGAAPAAAGTAAGAVAYAKARLAWIAVRKRMVADTDQLAAALQAEYAELPEGTQIVASYRARVAPVLESLDERLADKLDEAVNAGDPQGRAALVGEAREIIASYQAFVAGDKLIADLDSNPFVPLSIGKTLTATLGALSASVR